MRTSIGPWGRTRVDGTGVPGGVSRGWLTAGANRGSGQIGCRVVGGLSRWRWLTGA